MPCDPPDTAPEGAVDTDGDERRRATQAPPALAGPVRLRPWRARRLDLALIGGARGDTAVDLVGRMVEHGGTLDDAEALHVHEYTVGRDTVRGLVGLLDLSGPTIDGPDRAAAAMVPHEGVDPARVERLGARLDELGLDPAPVLLLGEPGTRGPDLSAVTARPPDHSGKDARGGRHRLWRVQDQSAIEALTRAAAASSYLLADGHHRYSAHLQRHHAAALAMLVDGDAPTLRLRPIHRLLHDVDVASVVAAVEHAGHVVGPAASDSARSTALTLLHDGPPILATLCAAEARTPLEEVDRVLRTVGARETTHHHSVPALRSALSRARRSGEAGVAVILSPPSLHDVWSAAREGRLMPEKSTSFQPKPPLGALFRSWHDG